MSALEDLVQAAMEAPASRRQDALRILRGEATEPPRAQPEQNDDTGPIRRRHRAPARAARTLFDAAGNR
jgi:hypothetical protein